MLNWHEIVGVKEGAPVLLFRPVKRETSVIKPLFVYTNGFAARVCDPDLVRNSVGKKAEGSHIQICIWREM